jgi:hypothetical protein
MGKWSKLKGIVEPFRQPETWQASIDEVKRTFVGLDSTELARQFKIVRESKRYLEATMKNINTELEAISQLLVEELESSELQKIQLTTGETVYINSEPYASVEDKAKLAAWVKKKKLQDLLTLNWQTLNGLTKGELEAGRVAPSGVKVFLKTSARLRGGASEEE